MTSAFYQRLFPTRLSPQKQSVQEFVTTRQGFRFALKPDEALSDPSAGR